MLSKTIELNDEEMDWLDEGHGFGALDDLPKEVYDEISYTIMLKIREAYNKAKMKKEKRYFLTLTKKEIDCIFEIMFDMLVDEYNWEIVEGLEDILPKYRKKHINDIKEQMALTNIIFKKIEKPLQTFDSLEKYLKELETLEDNEE